MPVRLGIVSTHPIQYYVPIYRELAAREDLEVTVFYCVKPSPGMQGEGFGVEFVWDRDLLSGYRNRWLRNIARSPDTDRFIGCNTPEIAWRILRGELDVVWVQGWNTLSMWQAMAACWLKGVSVLVRGDSNLPSRRSRWKVKLKQVVYPLFVRRFAVCLAVGQWSAEYFRHYGARRVVFSPHCVDNGWFGSEADRLRSERRVLRERWGIPADSVVFLFVGKLLPRKNPLDFLEAIGRLRDRNVWGLIAGDGPLRAECDRRIREEALPVTIAGFLNQGDLPAAYAASDCLVLPSAGLETWGLVVNEAMASEIPAIVADGVGSVPDLIRPGVTGFSFPAEDIERLTEQMQSLVSDPTLLARMRISAREHIQSYTVEAAAEGVVRAVREATSTGSKPPSNAM